MYLKSVLKYAKEILVARNTKTQPLIHHRVHEKHQKRRAQRNIWKTSKAQGETLNTILQFPYVPSLGSATASSFCLLITLPPTSFLFLLITLLWLYKLIIKGVINGLWKKTSESLEKMKNYWKPKIRIIGFLKLTLLTTMTTLYSYNKLFQNTFHVSASELQPHSLISFSQWATVLNLTFPMARVHKIIRLPPISSVYGSVAHLKQSLKKIPPRRGWMRECEWSTRNCPWVF